ncbi:permease domain-containing protein [Clostridium putrefaciens]|uniref:Permease domain-containing protein n=1 Tax=Clostridium putrefaciens TaxID=99675 RepID=A0A381J6R0_9CLOT|nr:ABC transporter permease [Clostridium putrefaciens]SUY46805.1 permease domain-containing protein [Clostridium putrefaciens]
MRTLNNIKSSYLCLSNRIIASIIILIQLTLSFVFFYEGVHIGYESYEKTKNMSKVLGDKSIYFLNEHSDLDYLNSVIFKQDDVITRMEEFENFLCDNDNFTIYRSNNEPLSIVNSKNIQLIKDQQSPNFKDGYDSVYGIDIDENFLKNFNYKLSEGSILDTDDFETTDPLNVLVGSDFKSYYKAGDTIDGYIVNLDKNVKLKIKGFIEKGELYVDQRFNASNIETMDNKIIFPRIKNLSKENEFYRYSLYTNYLETNVVSDLSHQKISELINNKSRELNLYDIEVLSKEGEMSYYKDITSRQLSLIFIIGALIILFTAINIITSLTDYIMKQRKEFAVNLMCGATKSDLIQGIYFTIIMLIVISLFLSNIFYKFIFKVSMDIFSFKFLSLIIFSVILSIVLLIIPYFNIRNNSLIEVLKDE